MLRDRERETLKGIALLLKSNDELILQALHLNVKELYQSISPYKYKTKHEQEEEYKELMKRLISPGKSDEAEEKHKELMKRLDDIENSLNENDAKFVSNRTMPRLKVIHCERNREGLPKQ